MKKQNNRSILALSVKFCAGFLGLSFLFFILSFLAEAFTAGGGDWFDQVYSGNIDLLVRDEIKVSFIVGFLSATYLATALTFALFISGAFSKNIRVILFIVGLIFALWIIAWVKPVEFTPLPIAG
jgi:hypothetical protein